MFIRELKIADLNRLRKIVRETHLKFYPSGYLSNNEVDKFIDSLGPETAGHLIKYHVDNRNVD